MVKKQSGVILTITATPARLAIPPLAGIEPALRRCAAPVRIVWGTGDTVFSQSSPDYLERTFANSRGVLRVPRAKIFFPEEMPELIAEEVMRLWRV